MKLKIYSTDGSKFTEKDFPAIETFEGNKGVQAVKDVVVAHMANARQGTRSTKTRGEVSGGGKKPFRQKGTGRARAGSTRSPLWSGGGVVFGPRPRDFSKKINAKIKALAFRRAFYDRAVAGEIDVIEAFSAPNAKTREVNAVLSKIAPKGRVLFVDERLTPELRRATGNLARVETQDSSSLNTLDLTKYRSLILSEKALEIVIARMKGAN
jgi:large subunit ribosomal protein L4